MSSTVVPFSPRAFAVVASPLALLAALALGSPSPSAAAGEATSVSLTGTCQPTATRLCLQGDQVAVDVTWNDPSEGAIATSIQDNAGWFSFDDPEAPEIVVEIDDACSLNGNYFVSAMGLSSREWQMVVTLVETGESVSYLHAAGPPNAFIDTQAIGCPTLASPRKISGTDGRSLNLWSGRFRATIDWQIPDGPASSAFAVPLGNQGGTFWFFTPSSLESSVKIEGAGPGFFRIVHSWVSSAEIDLEVVDRCTGQTANYNVAANSGPGATLDESTFPLSPNCALLVDGFERGDVSGWSSSVGGV